MAARTVSRTTNTSDLEKPLLPVLVPGVIAHCSTKANQGMEKFGPCQSSLCQFCFFLFPCLLPGAFSRKVVVFRAPQSLLEQWRNKIAGLKLIRVLSEEWCHPDKRAMFSKAPPIPLSPNMALEDGAHINLNAYLLNTTQKSGKKT